MSAAATTEMPEGLIKTVTKQGNGTPLKLGDIASVKYSCYLPDEAPFARSELQKVVRCFCRDGGLLGMNRVYAFIRTLIYALYL